MTFEEWVVSTQAEREMLDAYAKSPRPYDSTGRNADIDKATQYEGRAAFLLSQAEGYLDDADGRAVFSVKKENPELTAEERRRVAKAKLRPYQLIVDALSICRKTIDRRLMCNLNANRSRM